MRINVFGALVEKTKKKYKVNFILKRTFLLYLFL